MRKTEPNNKNTGIAYPKFGASLIGIKNCITAAAGVEEISGARNLSER